MVTKIDNPWFRNPIEVWSGRKTEANEEASAHFEWQIWRSKSIGKLSPENETRSKTLQQNIKSLLSNPRENLVAINKIIRDASQRLLLPSDVLREAFEALRKIHREEVDKNLDRGNTSAIKWYVTEELNQLSSGYHELFKNLQGHLDILEPLNEDAENIINFQDEVMEAEESIQQLLKKINSVGQMPVPLQQDIPPTSIQQDSDNWFIKIN